MNSTLRICNSAIDSLFIDFAAGIKMEAFLFLVNYCNLVLMLLSDWE